MKLKKLTKKELDTWKNNLIKSEKIFPTTPSCRQYLGQGEDNVN